MAALLLLPSSSSRGAAAGEVEEEPACLRGRGKARAVDETRTVEDGKRGSKNSTHAEVQHLLA